VVREAVASAVTVVAEDPGVQEPDSAVLMERLTTRRDPMPHPLQDPAGVRRRLAPLNEPVIGGRSCWQHISYRFVVEACRLARDGMVDGIVTAPLNKAAMQAGGHKWPGHTELLAHEFGVQNFSLVLSAGDLYFFHLTAHVSLQQAIENTTPERTDDILTLAGAFARALNKPDEAIGVCGLNPYAGETASSVTKTPTSSSQRSPGHENGASTPTAQSQPTRSSPPPSGQVEPRHRLLSRPRPRPIQSRVRRRRCKHHHWPARRPRFGRSRYRL
jgi:Pyridoxal phosphate biosynthetic protein PdxA